MNIEECTSPAKSLTPMVQEGSNPEYDGQSAARNQHSPEESIPSPKEELILRPDTQRSPSMATEQRSSGIKVDEEYFQQLTQEKMIEEKSERNEEEEEIKPETESKMRTESLNIETIIENVTENRIEEELPPADQQVDQERDVQIPNLNETPKKSSPVRQSLTQLELNENFRLVVMSFEKSLEKPRGTLAADQIDQVMLFRSDEKEPMETANNLNDKSLMNDNEELVQKLENFKAEIPQESNEQCEALEPQFDSSVENGDAAKIQTEVQGNEDIDTNSAENRDLELPNEESLESNVAEQCEPTQNHMMHIENEGDQEVVNEQNDAGVMNQESNQTNESIQDCQTVEEPANLILPNPSDIMEEEIPHQEEGQSKINQEQEQELLPPPSTSVESCEIVESQRDVKTDTLTRVEAQDQQDQVKTIPNKNENKQTKSTGPSAAKGVVKKSNTTTTMTSIVPKTNSSTNLYPNRFTGKPKAGEMGKTNLTTKTNVFLPGKLKIGDTKKSSTLMSGAGDEDKKVLSEVFAESRPKMSNLNKKRTRDQIAKSPERDQSDKIKETNLSKKNKLSLANGKPAPFNGGPNRPVLENAKNRSTLAESKLITQKGVRNQSKENVSTEFLKSETMKPEGKSSVPSKVTPKRVATCGICSAELQAGQMRTLACLHKFHQECFFRVNKKKVDCPICNGSLKANMTLTQVPAPIATKRF